MKAMLLTNENRLYMMLRAANGIGTVRGWRLLSAVKEHGQIYSELEDYRQIIVDTLGERGFEELKKVKKEINFDREEDLLDKYYVTPVGLSDRAYPKSLREIEGAPLVLFCRGDLSLLNSECFAVVGTRYPTRYGIRVTEEFVGELCKQFTIVSGMARGIDAYAHHTTLDKKGKTIAVLGCGVEQIYPAENTALYERLLENGLIISEYKVGIGAMQHHFPERNRIISGMSRGVLVTEAGEKSGTMLTINHALSQGREIFSVPGSIYNNASTGCNKLIRECQGAAVTSVEDIFSTLGIKKKEKIKTSVVQLDINEEILYSAIEAKGEAHFDELMEEVKLSVSQLNVLLVKMQAKGLIYKSKNNNWSIE